LVNRFLITTPLEETWPNDSKTPVLFLGEWCRVHSRKERWSKMNAEVLPYHWNDNHILSNNCDYLNKLYEVILQDLHKLLNEIHGINHSLRYWRILVGPWLGSFIQVVFERWSMLKHAFEKKNISGCKILLTDSTDVIPHDFLDWETLCANDNWNEALYSQLLQENWEKNIRIEYVKISDRSPKSYKIKNHNRIRLSRLKKYFLSIYKKYKAIFIRPDKYFLFRTYLPDQSENELLKRLGQKKKKWETPSIPMIEVNSGMRKWIINNYNKSDKFKNTIVRMIPKHIPKVYLEGYNSLIENIDHLSWPNNPKCIFSSNGIQWFDLFKAWVAKKTENGTSLVVGQHGGHYGIGKWNWFEEHEISISDLYLSWGWSELDKPKIRPVGQIQITKPLGVNHQKETGLLLVTNAHSKYNCNPVYSGTHSSQWLDYLDDQFQFINSLPNKLQDLLTIRLYPTDYGWEQEKRWTDRFPNVVLDLGKKNMMELIAKSRIYISTYNAATYLQAFSMDIPTIIFWNPKHWEIRDSSKPYFFDLMKVGIFHETPESAALHISKVWDDVDSWWKSKPVRKALEKFQLQYANTNCDLIGNIEKSIRI